MFLGTHAPHLDDKGRLILPAKYRDELAEGIVITKGQENCLYLFPRAEFERTAAAYAGAPLTDQNARNYQRVFFAGAEDLVPDKQGRITIPPHLREYAGLTRECRVIGMNAHLEIWEAAAWQAFLGAHESEFSATTREVRPGLM